MTAIRSLPRRAGLRRGPDPHRVLARAFSAHGDLVDDGWTRPWASCTFDGARHGFTLRCARAAADRLAGMIEDIDIPIPGHILASAAILRRHDSREATTLEIEALTVTGA